ncbi:GNAT family N-acetyltransferase [Candidatus Kaiserbacteria bacterium]|nr:GNAT family N-acetyltransferase [Candidatus Kaiserbacteria bacterium]
MLKSYPVPVLETDRLILRGWRSEDFEPYVEMIQDPVVARYLVFRPQGRDQAWSNMAMMIGHWAMRGYGFWALERKRDGVLLGRAGLWNPEGWPGLEVGWALRREYWGQGYATEAALKALEYAFRSLQLTRVLSVIHCENARSQRVAERIGAQKGPRQELNINGQRYTADIWATSC